MSKLNFSYRTQVLPADIEAVRDMAESTGFFYDFEIPVAVELVEDALADGEDSAYSFLFADVNGKPVAYTCFGKILGTDAGYDLYWIVTHNDYRGKGVGKQLLEETHSILRSLGARYVIAETSGLPKYEPTRNFYLNFGYKLEAEIRDFYKMNDSKMVYIFRF